MSWADSVIAAFDIETTGLDPVLDEIVQVAIVYVDGDGQLLPDSWTTIVNPGRPISPESVAVHGITDERAARDGIPADEAARRILERLASTAAGGVPIVVCNAPFDLGFMQVRARRLHLVLPNVTVIDPLVCDRAADRYRSGSRTLKAMAEHYGCPAEQLHDAAHDAAASVAVARAIAHRYPEIGRSSVADLYHRQIAWHADWAENFVLYQRRAGRDTASIDKGWPVPRRLSRPWWRFW